MPTFSSVLSFLKSPFIKKKRQVKEAVRLINSVEMLSICQN